MKIDIGRLNTNYIGKIATIPLIIVGVLWELGGGWIVTVLFRGFTLSKEVIGYSLFVEAPLILIVAGIWLSRFRLFLYLGRVGTIIWLLPFGFHTIIIFGELEHAAPIVLIVYFIVLLSTISVTFSLWKRKKKEGEHESSLR